MSVWGIGAFYKGSKPEDKTEEFLNNEKAYIGWNKAEAPALFRMLDSVKVGDIIYIKSFSLKSRKLNIKAIGIVTDTNKYKSKDFGTGICIKWKKDFKPITVYITDKIYKNNVFNNSLYEEFNDSIINLIIDNFF